MRKHISYPKINQFRQVVSNISRHVTYTGDDENGDPVYDHSITKPLLKFTGRVKVHGTNAGVSYNSSDGIYSQSRNNSFSLEENLHSHQGFTFFVKTNEDVFKKMFDDIYEKNDLDPSIHTATIYGEWAGNGIQKGVAVSEVDKFFVIFGVKISNRTDESFINYWVDYNYRNNDTRIFNIDDFGIYEVYVDFNMPQIAQNKFIDITNAVEAECPVGKQLGATGIGEGVVWSCVYKDTTYSFKVKGDKHSVTKVKKMAEVDVEKLTSIQEFIDYSVTKNRYAQAIENVFGKDELDVKKMGDFIRWIVNDIMSEELDTMVENGLEPKDVNKYISTKAREMFFSDYNQM